MSWLNGLSNGSAAMFNHSPEFKADLERRLAEYEADSERREKEHIHRINRVPRRYWEVSMDLIPDQLPHKSQLQNWHRLYLEERRKGVTFPGLYLSGPTGSGKSAIAAGVIKWGRNNGMDGLWIDYNEIIDLKTNDPRWIREVTNGIWDYAHRAHILVVDDVFRGGYENKYHNFQAVVLENLVRYRLSQELTTIMTSNLPLAEFSGVGLESMANVIDEACYEIKVTGANFRAYVKKARPAL